MTTEIIYTCDQCKAQPKGRNENGGHAPLWIVSITCEPVDNRSQYLTPTRHQRADFCRACVDALGIMTPLIRAETEEKPPSIEDMIRAIVREEKESE